MESVKDRLQKLMISRGITQADISRDTGISKASISSYLSGRKNPKQDKIYKIATRYQVDPAWLSGFDVPMEKKPEVKSKIGDYIRTHRELIGMTQAELGLMLDPPLNSSVVNMWERGEMVSIQASHIQQLAELFGVPMIELIQLRQDAELDGRLTEIYSTLNENSRERLLQYAKVLLDLQNGGGQNV